MTAVISTFTGPFVHSFFFSFKIFFNVYCIQSDIKHWSDMYQALESDKLDSLPSLMEFTVMEICYEAL